MQEQMLYNTLFGCRKRMDGRNFLYDAIEEGVEHANGLGAPEFTEADLIAAEPSPVDVVKS